MEALVAAIDLLLTDPVLGRDALYRQGNDGPGVPAGRERRGPEADAERAAVDDRAAHGMKLTAALQGDLRQLLAAELRG